ncbi:hypothetical protein [Enterococcus larvae]|uniref:hypothetical protein n=1 Tax=Enterococcus larvae TaxID=2794352 RepID=UPI003F2DED0B
MKIEETKECCIMTDKSKEEVFAERQDNYKQEKEEIFKKALKEEKEKAEEKKNKE